MLQNVPIEKSNKNDNVFAYLYKTQLRYKAHK